MLKPFTDKGYGYYNLILNLDDINIKKDEFIPFYVRMFSNKSNLIFNFKKLKLMNLKIHMKQQLKVHGKRVVVEEL